MQREGIDFYSTFATVVNWSTVRLIIMMAEMARWESRQIDYVLDLFQSPIIGMFILIYQQFFHVYGEEKNETHFLKLKKIYMKLVKLQKIGLICQKLDLKMKVSSKTNCKPL